MKTALEKVKSARSKTMGGFFNQCKYLYGYIAYKSFNEIISPFDARTP